MLQVASRLALACSGSTFLLKSLLVRALQPRPCSNTPPYPEAPGCSASAGTSLQQDARQQLPRAYSEGRSLGGCHSGSNDARQGMSSRLPLRGYFLDEGLQCKADPDTNGRAMPSRCALHWQVIGRSFLRHRYLYSE